MNADCKLLTKEQTTVSLQSHAAGVFGQRNNAYGSENSRG